MTLRKCASLAGMAFVLLLAAVISGCSGGGSIGTTNAANGGGSSSGGSGAINISLSETRAIVDEGATAQFTAMVTNDGANKGVTWTVSCSAAACGSLSPTSTASGALTTFTPPGSPASNLTVTLTAASVADTTKSASVTVTVPALTVSLMATGVTVVAGNTAQFTATVSNDGANKGVTWAVACLSAQCGSVSPTSTASGVATIYTAPAAPPTSGLTVTVMATSVTDGTKAASATVTVPVIGPSVAVSISPSSASVPSGGTQQFTATVGNDPNGAGVTWQVVAKLFCDGITVRCNPLGEPPIIFLPCTGCGTVSPTSTASGTPLTYTAPAHLTPPSKPGYFFCNVCGGSVLIVATSVTNTSVSARAVLTIAPISISVSPTQAKLVLSATQQFTATVTNDGTNSGVSWSVTENGVPCSPSCGTIAPATTVSGATATYIAPATSPVTPLVTVTATSIEDPIKPASATVTLTTSSGDLACGAGSGSESLLKGQYAFLLQGDLYNFGEGSMVGSFTADGMGKITAGEEDLLGQETLTIDTTTSSYAVGPDHRGCLLLTNFATVAFSFALGSLNSSSVATAGHMIEIDGILGVGLALKRGSSGIIRLQDPTSFTAGQFNGNYAVGFIGSDQQNLQNGSRRVAIAGTFTADGASAISSGTFDINDLGAITADISSTPEGTFTCCDANGRGALTLANLRAPNVGFYVINSGDVFLVADDNNFDAIQGVGEAISILPGKTFTQASLNGSSVLRETAQSASGAEADIATVTSDGKTAMTVNDNLNSSGAFTTSSTALNYSVASNGRVTFTGGSTPPVVYLYGPNQGFLVGTDPDVTFGILEPQATGPFSDASFSGTYVLGTENPSANTVTTESGVLTADGKGNAAGSSDQSSTAGPAQNQPLNLTYSISANGTGTFGIDTTSLLISGNKLVFISNTSANPTITVVEK